MTDLQRTFYIIASIALGLFALFQIFMIVFLIAVQRRIARTSRKIHFIARELRELARSGQSYSKYVGASVFGSVLRSILHMLRGYRASYED